MSQVDNIVELAPDPPTERPRGEPWQRALRDAVRDPAELAALLELPQAYVNARVDLAPGFALLAPRRLIARMRRGDPNDPLLAQVLPRIDERMDHSGYSADPLDERSVSASGMLRKYPGRALLITTAACPVHCRYCFRRHFPYASELAAREGWRPVIASLAASPATSEIILSGGDPLSLTTRRLAELVRALEQLPQIEDLRIHTRFPIMIPERVDDALIELLAATRLRVAVVVHANHPSEFDADVRAALLRLASVAHTLLNQSVLLRDINDDAETLAQLSRALYACRVLPYYLHQLDHVAGAAHFAVSDTDARRIVAALRATLPGFLVPRLVREEPGELSKTPIL